MEWSNKMQNVLKAGKHPFIVTGVMRKDKDGNNLRTKNGNSYTKLKLSVMDANEEPHNVYDFIFARDKVDQIVNAIGNPELKRQAKNKDFRLEDLVGEEGVCLTRIKEGKNGFSDQTVVECYVKQAFNFMATHHTKGHGTANAVDTRRDPATEAFLPDDDNELPF